MLVSVARCSRIARRGPSRRLLSAVPQRNESNAEGLRGTSAGANAPEVSKPSTSSVLLERSRQTSESQNVRGAGVNIHTGEPVNDPADILSTGEGKKSLPFLPRPLGVREPPTTEKLSWEERKAKILNYDEHLKERKHIVKELATKGYWTDMNRLKEYGGKMWIAAPALIREDAALYFPDIVGTALDPRQPTHTTDLCRGHISIISVVTTLMSEGHVKSFVEPILESLEANPRFRFVTVNLQENPLKSFLVSFFVSRMKAQVPVNQHATYLLSHQNMEYLREDIGLMNKHVGFVYLVDANLKVRWAGCGFARSEERESLQACAEELLERLGKTSQKPSKKGKLT